MAAFAYEQCHLLDEAEQAARTALAMKRKEPWAQHALAHVHADPRPDRRGSAVSRGAWRGTWTGLNSFMFTHLWWHLALFYLSQGRVTRVLEIYDRHCWGVAKDYSQDQIGAVSLLARMEIAGIDVGHPLAGPGRSSGGARARYGAAVSDAAIFVRPGAGAPRRSRTRCWRRCERTAKNAPRSRPRGLAGGGSARLRRSLRPCPQGLTTAPGVTSAARMPRMTEIGGSHAQRDLFEQILLDAAIKSRRTVAAQQMLELRRIADPAGRAGQYRAGRGVRRARIAATGPGGSARAARDPGAPSAMSACGSPTRGMSFAGESMRAARSSSS